MNAKTVTGMVLGLTVIIVLVATFLLPVVNEAVDSNKETLTNTSGIKGYMELVEDTATASYDGTTLTINGVTTTSFGATYSMITADSFLVRTTSGGCAFYSIDGTASLGSWSMSCDNGTCTVTDLSDETTTYTYEYDWLFFPTENNAASNWIMTTGNTTYYVSENSQVYMSVLDSKIVIEGEVGDLQISSSGTTNTYTLNAESVDGYEEDTYKLTNIIVDVDGTQYDLKRLVIPTSVEVTIEGTGVYNTLYNLIPILVIISILLASVTAVISGRNN